MSRPIGVNGTPTSRLSRAGGGSERGGAVLVAPHL